MRDHRPEADADVHLFEPAYRTMTSHAADIQIEPYDGPAGGWGSAKSLAVSLAEQNAPSALAALVKQNKADGFACVSCAWAKPANSHLAEFCENGAKATFAELTSLRAGPEFFAAHSLADLRALPDHDLEIAGRLTMPMRYDDAVDRYVPVPWDEAFNDIGQALKRLQATPESVVFYASGRASLETSYLYQLLARRYGCNNLPDSSNMCHESTSVGLKQAIGVPVGTVTLDDFAATDCFLFFGQNVGSNSPRMLHDLQEAAKRGVPIIAFNPLRERGLERFTNPQSPTEMLTGQETRISTDYLQVKAGGDIALITGLCKVVLELDAVAVHQGTERVLDHEFLLAHTHGFDEFAAFVRRTPWPAIELESGLPRHRIEAAATVYARAKSVIGVYGMGLTQHRHGVDNVRMLVNLLLLRGNIGRRGAGPCPVRGHSNVQGQRTVGISEKPELVPLDVLAGQFDFEPPRVKGLNTIETCEGVLDGSVKAFIGLGGNFVRAVPDPQRIEPAWRRLDLTVHVATKLNRSHLLPGRIGYLLPCLGRIEVDRPNGVAQTASIEDSTSCIHASIGHHKPASEHLLSESRIVANIALATLPANAKLEWDRWANDYASVRRCIAVTYPVIFKDYERRMREPGGFHRPLPARHREWKTPSGRAEFKVPAGLSAASEGDGGVGIMRLMTLRSNDQFNTTIYGYDDRFRGIKGTRDVLLMHVDDMADGGWHEGDIASLTSAAADGIARRLDGLRVTAYDLPRGCVGGYYPECNAVMSIENHALESKVPGAKSVPVRVVRDPAA